MQEKRNCEIYFSNYSVLHCTHAGLNILMEQRSCANLILEAVSIFYSETSYSNQCFSQISPSFSFFLSIYNLFVIHHLSNCPVWLLTVLHSFVFLTHSPAHPHSFATSSLFPTRHKFKRVHPQCASFPSCPPLLPSIRGVGLSHWLWRGGTGERSVWHGALQSLWRAHWRGGDWWHGANYWCGWTLWGFLY